MKLKLHFSFEAVDDEGVVKRQDEVNRELEFDNKDTDGNFIARMESFFQELLFAYVPDYPLHKAAKVTRLDVKPTDWVIVEYVQGSIDPNELRGLVETFEKGVSRCDLVCLNPGRGELKFTAIGKE